MNDLPKEVHKLALSVRRAYFKFIRENPYFEDPDIQIDYYDDDLGGACNSASKALVLLMRKNGYRPQFILGEFFSRLEKPGEVVFFGDSHCWVEWHNLIIDVTATQFGIKKAVFVTDAHDPRYRNGKRVDIVSFHEQKQILKYSNLL